MAILIQISINWSGIWLDTDQMIKDLMRVERFP